MTMMKHWRNFGAALAACSVAAVLFNGCTPKEAKAARDRNVEVKPASWNWEEYPPVNKMRLGVLSCLLQPRSTISVASPLTGLLKVHATAPQTNLPSGFLWAEFEPEIFAAEAKSLTEALKKLEDRETMEREVEFPRRKMQLAKQIEEAERQLTWMRIVSTNKELTDLMFSTGPNGGTLRPDSLRQSEMELRLLEQSMNYLETTNHAAMGVDLAGQRTDWERRKLEFDRRRSQARFRMPFDGRLTLNIPLSDGVTDYPVTAGQELGVARDVSSIRVRVPVENVAWSGLPVDKLTAVVRVGEEVFHARFSFQKIERAQNREESVYYFEVPDEQSAKAAKLIGANVSCELWLDLWEHVRIVPKLALILRKPDAFKNQSWAWALNELFPGTRLVVEGQTELAVAIPREMKVSSVR
jgi:hypothetical protein